MVVRKTPLFVSALIVAGSTATVAADLQGISADVTSHSWGVTYAIYANVDAGDQVNAVYGDADNPLSVEASGAFYQNAFGGNTPPNPALIALFPSLAYDSFVTIGRATDVDNAMLEIGIDWTSFEAGGSISTDNGSWFATPDDAQVYEVDGRVMIMQLTLAETEYFTFAINMQGKNADGSNWTAIVHHPIPAPGALALLGIAGITVSRRRR